MQKRLTNEERAKAYYMWLEGHTLREIADQFGVTCHAVRRYIPERLNKYEICSKSCIYPNIANWMVENKHTYSSFSDLIGMSYGGFRNSMQGKSSPTKITIDAILKLTGMPYEEAFSMEENENG